MERKPFAKGSSQRSRSIKGIIKLDKNRSPVNNKKVQICEEVKESRKGSIEKIRKGVKINKEVSIFEEEKVPRIAENKPVLKNFNLTMRLNKNSSESRVCKTPTYLSNRSEYNVHINEATVLNKSPDHNKKASLVNQQKFKPIPSASKMLKKTPDLEVKPNLPKKDSVHVRSGGAIKTPLAHKNPVRAGLEREPPSRKRSNSIYNSNVNDSTYENLIKLDEDRYDKRKGFKESELKQLNVVQYRGRAEKECVICLDQIIKNQRISFLACTHSFHEGCIKESLSRQKKCPECYTELDFKDS